MIHVLLLFGGLGLTIVELFERRLLFTLVPIGGII